MSIHDWLLEKVVTHNCLLEPMLIYKLSLKTSVCDGLLGLCPLRVVILYASISTGQLKMLIGLSLGAFFLKINLLTNPVLKFLSWQTCVFKAHLEEGHN